MNATRDRALTAFTAAFGGRPDIEVRAPGRVNLIGEHTDYNDGFVLPCAIGMGTTIVARRRTDARVEVAAADFGGARDGFALDSRIAPVGGWADYVRGMVASLQGAGLSLVGADLAIAGDVPQGSGLSSSASLEVGIGHSMTRLAEIDLDTTRLAQLAQAAENDFVGCKCGIMDQLVSARGIDGHAVLIDCRSLETQPVPVPNDITVLIVHSGIVRGLVEGAYNERRAQCEAAARHYGVAVLRDIDLATLGSAPGALDPLSWRRARHVVTENARTLACADALARADLDTVGKLMADSHVSMRDDFDITLPAIDDLVALLAGAIGSEGGARMTGGGFGGAVVALTTRERAGFVIEEVRRHYRTPKGTQPDIYVEKPHRGVFAIDC